MFGVCVVEDSDSVGEEEDCEIVVEGLGEVDGGCDGEDKICEGVSGGCEGEYGGSEGIY